MTNANLNSVNEDRKSFWDYLNSEIPVSKIVSNLPVIKTEKEMSILNERVTWVRNKANSIEDAFSEDIKESDNIGKIGVACERLLNGYNELKVDLYLIILKAKEKKIDKGYFGLTDSGVVGGANILLDSINEQRIKKMIEHGVNLDKPSLLYFGLYSKRELLEEVKNVYKFSKEKEENVKKKFNALIDENTGIDGKIGAYEEIIHFYRRQINFIRGYLEEFERRNLNKEGKSRKLYLKIFDILNEYRVNESALSMKKEVMDLTH